MVQSKRMRISAGIAIGALASLALTSCAAGGDSDQGGSADQVTIQYQALDNEDNYLGLIQADIADRIAEETDGNVNIEITYAAGLNVNGGEVVNAVSTGIIDGGGFYAGQVSSTFSLGDIIELPFLVPYDPELRLEVIDALFPVWEKALREDFGFQLLAVHQMAPRSLFTSSQVKSIDDVKGLLIRANGPEGEFTDSLGAAATVVDYAELYTALQQGAVDGTWLSDDAVPDRSFEEVTGFKWAVEQGGGALFVGISSTIFDSLSADDQAAVRDAAREAAQDAQLVAGPKNVEEMGLALEGLGVVSTTPSDEELAAMTELAKPTWDDWVARNGDAGKELMDTVLELVGN